MSLLHVAHSLNWSPQVVSALGERVRTGAFEVADLDTRSAARSFTAPLIRGSGSGSKRVLPGSPILDVFEASGAALERLGGPVARKVLESTDEDYWENRSHEPAEWPNGTLPTRPRLLAAPFLITLTLAIRTEDEELRLACLSSEALAPEAAADLTSVAEVPGLLAQRSRSWRRAFITHSALAASEGFGEGLGAVVACTDLDEVLEALAPNRLDADLAFDLREAVLSAADESDPRLLTLVERTAVSTMDGDQVEEVLLPHLASALGDDASRWDVLVTLVDTFTGTVAELVSACTELS